MPTPLLVSTLARSFLAGELETEAVTARGAVTLGRRWQWLRPLAQRYVAAFVGRTRPRHRDVILFLQHDEGFQKACARHAKNLRVEHWLSPAQQMQPVRAAQTWDLPLLESAGELAAWLGVSPQHLDWFADVKGLCAGGDQSRLSHYHYRALTKSSGAIRLVEIPKPRLKALQRRILSGILEKVPNHAAAHGFVKKRSVRSFAAPHAGRRVVLRMDLRDFFASIAAARVQAVFRTMGYPESVANLITGICTNTAPRELWHKPGLDVDTREIHEAQELYGRPHLPQGAPTSPALANVCAYRFDCRLSGLAVTAGAEYTRYADDLAFSGDERFARQVEGFAIHVAAMLLEEGFDPHHRKTRIMRQGVRQHLTGLVLNERLNVHRRDYDRLKATLTNCVRFGPASQNRDAHHAFRMHLAGRVAFVEWVNPAKGQHLRGLFDGIVWP